MGGNWEPSDFLFFFNFLMVHHFGYHPKRDLALNGETFLEPV
jgi:hypothetical protein